MTVTDLMEELRAMPPDAPVFVIVRMNLNYEGGLEELYEFRDAPIEAVTYSSFGRVQVRLDEDE
jgi:hypothetical protein